MSKPLSRCLFFLTDTRVLALRRWMRVERAFCKIGRLSRVACCLLHTARCSTQRRIIIRRMEPLCGRASELSDVHIGAARRTKDDARLRMQRRRREEMRSTLHVRCIRMHTKGSSRIICLRAPRVSANVYTKHSRRRQAVVEKKSRFMERREEKII